MDDMWTLGFGQNYACLRNNWTDENVMLSDCWQLSDKNGNLQEH